jgi:hypothetical protein
VTLLIITLHLIAATFFCKNSYFGSGPDIFNPDDNVNPYNLYNDDNKLEPVYNILKLPTID